jgi:hypothetical protein
MAKRGLADAAKWTSRWDEIGFFPVGDQPFEGRGVLQLNKIVLVTLHQLDEVSQKFA